MSDRRKPGWKWLFLGIVLIAAVVIGLLLWKAHSDSQPDIPRDFSKTYSGMRWTYDDDSEQAIPVSITFDGEISDDPVFKGSIKVETAEEVLYHYESCCVYRDENLGLLFICDSIPKEEWEFPSDPLFRNYGAMMVSDDWSEVVLFYMKEELGSFTGPKEEIIAAPASTKEEAVAIAQRLDDGTPFEDNGWE